MPGHTEPWYKRVYDWVERRVQLEGPVKDAVLHPVPRSTASWWYVFGSASLVLLILQVATGILLALVYEPSAAHAWNSLELLNHELPLGWFLRAMHGWGSNFMVAVVLIHMAQVFLFGAYKFPRELTWIVGVIMLLMTLGMAFTGQVLRFDQDAYWGLGIGASIVGRVPWIGGQLVHLMLGGPMINGATLTRFFALHVFIIPGTLLAFTGLHVWMVLKLGINEWPMPGRIVRRETYIEEYNELTHSDGIPFVPGAVWKDLVFSAAILFAVACCAAAFGPYGPKGVPDPTIINTVPKPDFFFLWIYTVLSFLPPEMETPFILIAPVVAIAVLIGLPFVAGIGREELVAAAGGGVRGDVYCGVLGRVDEPGDVYTVESEDGCVERRGGAGELVAEPDAIGTAGSECVPGEAVPQLPSAWQPGRRARAGIG